MSRANAQVKFPDGTIKFGIYNGTVDYYWEPLFDSPDKAWAAWEEYYATSPLDDSKWINPYDDTYYDVDLADDYGGGSTYFGKASKSQIVGATDTDKLRHNTDGLPEWWVKP